MHTITSVTQVYSDQLRAECSCGETIWGSTIVRIYANHESHTEAAARN